MKQLKGLLATAKWWYFFLTYARFLSRNSPSVLKRGGRGSSLCIGKKIRWPLTRLQCASSEVLTSETNTLSRLKKENTLHYRHSSSFSEHHFAWHLR